MAAALQSAGSAEKLLKPERLRILEKRPKGNCLERVVRATACFYVISPLALGRLGESAAGVRDRFSAAYLVSAAARTIRDVAVLRATLTLETGIRFASAEARRQLHKLASKYNSESRADVRSALSGTAGRRFWPIKDWL
jgi:hypothetical protein